MSKFAFGLLIAGTVLMPPSVAQALDDILNMIEQDVREHYQERARQRLRTGQAETAAENLQVELPDLSQFGTPVEPQILPRSSRARAPRINCVTIDLAKDMRATNCF